MDAVHLHSPSMFPASQVSQDMHVKLSIIHTFIVIGPYKTNDVSMLKKF